MVSNKPPKVIRQEPPATPRHPTVNGQDPTVVRHAAGKAYNRAGTNTEVDGGRTIERKAGECGIITGGGKRAATEDQIAGTIDRIRYTILQDTGSDRCVTGVSAVAR